MRWLTIAVAITALALVGAGCGGGDDESSSDTDTVVATDTTATDDTTTDETETDDTTTDETETGASGGLPSGDCINAVSAFAALTQAVATAGSSAGDASDSARAFQEFAAEAPDEIKDDIQVLGDAYAEYIAVLSGLGLDAGDAPSADQIEEITQASEKLTTPEVLAASESFSAWAQDNCPGG
jgi:hypothetical protein